MRQGIGDEALIGEFQIGGARGRERGKREIPRRPAFRGVGGADWGMNCCPPMARLASPAGPRVCNGTAVPNEVNERTSLEGMRMSRQANVGSLLVSIIVLRPRPARSRHTARRDESRNR